jgi:ABC-type branched-subunit amino acid transport system ATPase component
VDSFSGGWRMRLALARALMAPSELLLLDEPTNHLDLDAMLWLERWLAAYAGTVLLISHDTEFLDAVAQTILHFDQGKLNRYKGGYQDFVVQRAERLRQGKIAYERQTRETARLQGFIDRFKAKASKAKQAQSRVKALARMEQLAPIRAESGIDIRIPSTEEMPDPLLVLDDMQAGYTTEQGEVVTILRHVKLMVRGGDRIGILGVNGAGKSTTLLAISKIIAATSGTIEYQSKPQDWVNLLTKTSSEIVRMGVSQVAEGRAILLTMTVEENLQLGAYTRERVPQIAEDLKFVLELFPILKNRYKDLAGNLSGGEQQMLAIGRALMAKPKLLLLDEPSMGLAPLKVKEIFNVLKELNQLGQSIVLVEQNVRQALQISHQAYVLENGELTLAGVGKELLEDPRIIQAYLGT